MERIKKIFNGYSAKLKKLKDYERKHGAILRRHFKLQEMEVRAKFKAQEQVDMLMETGKVTEKMFLYDQHCEMRIYPKLRTVSIFDKRKYKKQPK